MLVKHFFSWCNLKASFFTIKNELILIFKNNQDIFYSASFVTLKCKNMLRKKTLMRVNKAVFENVSLKKMHIDIYCGL